MNDVEMEFFRLLRAGRLPEGHHFRNALMLAGSRVRRLPAQLTIDGQLDLRQCERLRFLGEGLCVGGDLRIGGTCPPGDVSPAAELFGASRERYVPLESLPEGLTVLGSLSIAHAPRLRAFPARFSVGGSISLVGNRSLAALPRGLHVNGDLTIIGGPALTALPEGLHVTGSLLLVGTQITALPPDIHVGGDITLIGCRKLTSIEGVAAPGDLTLRDFAGETLPDGLTVEGTLRVKRPWALTETPRDLMVGKSIDIRRAPKLQAVRARIFVGEDLRVLHCKALTALPAGLAVPGTLTLTGCSALPSLPRRLRAEKLVLADCAALETVPDDLRVAQPIEIAGTGLRSWPTSLWETPVLWRQVRVLPEVVFAPEKLPPDRIFLERNAELRRVMLERAGIDDVLKRAGAVVVESDRDPGGPRSLLEVSVPDPWPPQRKRKRRFLLCSCPSTGRRYLLHVPATLRTCHAAAAWLAGFDDPAQYRPVQET